MNKRVPVPAAILGVAMATLSLLLVSLARGEEADYAYLVPAPGRDSLAGGAGIGPHGVDKPPVR